MPKVKALLTKMRCLEETSEPSASDEPYVLVFAAQLKSVSGLVTIPSAQTVMYGPWESSDEGDLLTTGFVVGGKVIVPPANFWGLDGKPQNLSNLDEVIFITALMENDDAQPGGIRAGTHAQMFAAITSYANSGMSRASMVTKLKKDMRDILTGVTVTGIPSSDDLIGVAEVRFAANALQAVANGPVVQNIELAGDGGKYRLRFELVAG
jgi:hypothetical protein